MCFTLSERKTHMTKESPLKHYVLSIPSVFADLINGILHEGKQKIESTDLTLVDPSEFYCPEIKSEPFYDCLCVMTSSKVTYALYSVEDQSQIDASLVAKIAMYNATRYFKEIEASSCCKPIISLVVNFDVIPWGLPTSLCDAMGMDASNEWMLRYVTDYRITLYDPHTKDDFNVFQTELKTLFEYLKRGQTNMQIESNLTTRMNLMAQLLQDKCLLDDLLMKLVMGQNISAVQLVLRIVLNKKDLIIRSVEYHDGEHFMHKQLWYVAIEAVDGNNKTYNIEVRNFYSHTDLAGVLYRFSFINDSLLEFAKNDIDQFPVRYVVFISRMDMMAEGMPTYTFLLHEEMPHKPLGDNSHVVFVNGIYEDDKSDIGKLMHDFRCKEPSKMYFDVLAKAVRHFKNDGKLV